MLVERQQKKVIRYYVIWTIVYLPLTILGFYKAGDGFVKSFVQFIRNVFFQGENYYSWPLWYLLSAVYGLTILKLLVESQKETKKFNFYSIIIIFFCVFMHFATDYIVNLNTTNNVVVTFSLLVEKTIRKGRIFSGVYYILLGNLIAKSEYHIGRIYLLWGYFTLLKKRGSPMMNKRAPRHSDEERHQIILAARASGLSDFEYCRNNSIPSSTFYRALARLRQQACELPARSERLECKREVVPINISELPISREDRMHPVSHVVDEPSPASFEATMRITFGGGTLELTNQADTALVASILSMLRGHWGLTP